MIITDVLYYLIKCRSLCISTLMPMGVLYCSIIKVQHPIVPKSGSEAINRIFLTQLTSTTGLRPNNIELLGYRTEKLGSVSAP